MPSPANYYISQTDVLSLAIVSSLIWTDGNAFALIGGWKRAARREGWSDDEINAVIAEAKSGDYDHLVQTIMGYSE